MYVIRSTLTVLMCAVASHSRHEDNSTTDSYYQPMLSAEELDCLPSVESWIPGCGMLKPPNLSLADNWTNEFIDYEISERKFLVVIEEMVDYEKSLFPGVLFTEKCVVALCSNFRKYTFAAKKEIFVYRPSDGEIQTYACDQTVNTLQRPCSLRYQLYNIPILLESAMSRSDPIGVITDIEELPNNELCRYYSILRESDMKEEIQPKDFFALPFIAKDAICPEGNQQNQICGLIFDPRMRFCSLVPGGIVFCRGNLLGTVKSICCPQTAFLYVNKTAFPVWVMTVSSSQMKYWGSLGVKNQDFDPINERIVAGVAWSNKATIATIHICLVVYTIAKYTSEHRSFENFS